MEYTLIDLETYPRRAHYEYFSQMANPYVGVTVQADISGFVERCREQGVPFFLSFLYCVGRAANAVPELRQRILDGVPVEFPHCDTSHTVMRENGTYSYCRLNPMQPFADFLAQAIPLHQKAKLEDNLDDGEDGITLLFISSLPWLSYTQLQQPTPSPADSNVRITWGRYETANGKTTIPVTLLAHHALVDGVHLAQFYQKLQENIHSLLQ